MELRNMLNFIDGKPSKNRTNVVKYLFKGLKISEISQKLNCSQSCVSYHISNLYAKYHAKNRSEFILSVLADIIDGYKQKLAEKQDKVNELEQQLTEIKINIANTIYNIDNDENLKCWILKLKKYI